MQMQFGIQAADEGIPTAHGQEKEEKGRGFPSAHVLRVACLVQ